ncbi:MAG: TIGR03087 family PEP-CTERM/XrtA system glycosyltransferase [bacterium]|nr:TIGR03087 family PEP-CTERM/XrtA system glycosyltransferase [bacterium]
MNILFLAHRLPYPPHKGDTLRSFNIIKHLAKEHRISLLCPVFSEKESKNMAGLAPYCDDIEVVNVGGWRSKLRLGAALLSGKSLTVAHFYSSKLPGMVKTKLAREKFDMIMTYSSSMTEYVKDIKGIPRVADFCDVDSEKWRQCARWSKPPLSLIYRLEAKRLRRYETETAACFDYLTFISKQEKEIFSSFASHPAIEVIPNGVDSEYFQPQLSGTVQQVTPGAREPKAEYDSNSLVFTGVMDYFPNVDGVIYFVKEVFPLIKRQLPRAKFLVVGSSPARSIKALAKIDGVTVTGYVPDIRPYLVNSALACVPLRMARGVQNKILEAVACGTPVVATSNAFEGLEAIPVRLADTPRQFAREVVKIMTDRKLRAKLSIEGQKMVRAKYNWDTILKNLDRIISKIEAGGAKNFTH